MEISQLESENSRSKSDYLITKEGDSFSINLGIIRDFVKKKLKVVILTTAFTFIVGIMIAVFSPIEYEATMRLIQEKPQQERGASSLLNNFNPFGGSFGQNAETFGASTYPDIVASTPFGLDLIGNKVFFYNLDSSMVIERYFDEIVGPSAIDIVKNYTIYLPSRLLKKLDSKQLDVPVMLPSSSNSTVSGGANEQDIKPLKITRKQISILKQVTSRVTISSTGSYVDITCKMPDPIAAAEMTQLVYKGLTDYIIKNKIRKATVHKDFIEARAEEAKAKFYDTQQNLAAFQDENRNISSAAAQAEERKLQAEYELAFNLYKTLSVQLEQARIKVKEDTPVFSVMEPVQIPNEKSEPQRIKIVFVSTFLGVFFGFAILTVLFLKGNYKYLISLN